MEWTKEIVTEFIELYRERPCLWKIKDADYVNKNLKREAYQDLIKFLKSKNYNDITIKDVKTKIQNMRNAFRREYKKLESSNRSGSGTEDVYVPTLWYYNLLLFTKDQDVPLASIDSTQNSQSIEDENQTETCDEDDLNQSGTTNEAGQEQVENVFKQPPERKIKKKRNSNTDIDEFVKVCTKKLSNPDKVDEFDSACMSFAAKLRKMNANQQIFAESLMHKICTLGLLNKLNENYCVTDNTRMLAQSHSSNSFGNDYQHLVQTQVISPGQPSYSTSTNMWQTDYQPVQPPLPSPDESTQSSTSPTYSAVADYYNKASSNDFQ